MSHGVPRENIEGPLGISIELRPWEIPLGPSLFFLGTPWITLENFPRGSIHHYTHPAFSQIVPDRGVNCWIDRGELRIKKKWCRTTMKSLLKALPPGGGPAPIEKSRIRETPTLSTDADSRTDTILERLRHLPIRTEKRTLSTPKCGLGPR